MILVRLVIVRTRLRRAAVGIVYYLDPKRALQSLWSALEEVGIKPKVARAVPRDAFVQQPPLSIDLPRAI